MKREHLENTLEQPVTYTLTMMFASLMFIGLPTLDFHASIITRLIKSIMMTFSANMLIQSMSIKELGAMSRSRRFSAPFIVPSRKDFQMEGARGIKGSSDLFSAN